MMTTHSATLFLFVLILLSPTPCTSQSNDKPADGKSKTPPRRISPSQPTEPPSHYEKAEALLKEAKFVEAIAEYKNSLEDHPENEAAYFGMALAQTQAGLAKEAVLSYEAALKINAQLWEAETKLGMLLMNQQSFLQALQHLQKACALNPKNFQPAFFAAKALESLGRWNEAAEAGLRALPLAEDSAAKFEVHATLGVLYLKAGSLEDAEKH